MEKQLRIVSKLPLQEMVLRRIVIHLWNEDTILDCFLFDHNNYHSESPGVCCSYVNCADEQNSFENRILCSEKWRNVTETVKQKVFELPLPISIKEEMVHIVKVIGMEILRWKISLHSDPIYNVREYFDIYSLKQLCWTSAGTVDYKKTAKKLDRFENIDVVKRFQLSCSCYLIDQIPSLWGQLPEDNKNVFYKDDPMSSKYYKYGVTRHQIYWFCVLNGLENKLVYWNNQAAFEYSAREGNKAATEYYFQKLTDEERESSLQRVACLVIGDRCRSRDLVFPMGNLSNVLCYLLSLMNPSEQMEVFVKQPFHFLRCFLDWPWHDLFSDILDLAWDRLSQSDYKSLFSYIAEHIYKSGFYFPNLFQSFILRNSRSERTRFAQDFAFITGFFFVGDVEPLLMILRNIDDSDRVSLLTSHYFFQSLDNFLMRDKCELLEVFLREAFHFIDRENLKFYFMKWLNEKSVTAVELRCRERKWNELCESLNISDA